MQFVNRNKNEGFTLIELMVVVAIIAALAAIGVPNFIYARKRAFLANCEANLRGCANAISIYHTDTRTWPGGLDALMTQGYLLSDESLCCPLSYPQRYTFTRFYPGDTEYDDLGQLFEIECPNTSDGGGDLTHVGRAGPRSSMKVLKYIWGRGIFTVEE